MSDVDSGSPGVSRKRWWLFGAVLVIAIGVAALLLESVLGELGLKALAVGLLFGAVAIVLGKLSVRRQAEASPARLMRTTLLASFVGIFVFLIGTIVASKVWKEGYKPAVLVALVLYLSFKFFEVWNLVSKMQKPAGGPDDPREDRHGSIDRSA